MSDCNKCIWSRRDGGCNSWDCSFIDQTEAANAMPSAQPQLEDCPIYGGMCGYPSNLCYECPRHEGAKEQPQWWTEGLQPFAQPQRMKGKWTINDCHAAIYKYHCSECGANHRARYDFCPSCGADMRGEDDAVD